MTTGATRGWRGVLAPYGAAGIGVLLGCALTDMVGSIQRDGPAAQDGGGQPDWCAAAPPTCTGTIGATTFVNALCTCRDVRVAGSLLTRSFISTEGPFQDTSNRGGAGVGVNRNYAIGAGYTDIGGSFVVSGPASLTMAGYLHVRGDLQLAGDALVPGVTQVDRDAWLGGVFTGLGPFTVQRNLHRAGDVQGLPLLVGGENTQEAITVAAPCPCATQELVDIAGPVELARVNNDNAALGISPTTLADVTGDVTLTLPCGLFFLESIGGAGHIILNVTGRIALFVAGDVNATGLLEVRLAPAAEIDLFIAGQLVSASTGVFGSRDSPASTRVFVGGADDILLAGVEFFGNLYAPRARVLATDSTTVWGSVFALDFSSNPGQIRINYDGAIVNAGRDCRQDSPPPQSCRECGICADALACVDGTCGPCRSDADCCFSLVCNQDHCVPLNF